MSDYIITSNGLQSTDELKHYGVLGMKWGVRRRYLNKNGGITRRGMTKYNQVSAREQSASRGEHGKKVLAKYEKIKTTEQKRSDAQNSEAMRRLNQSRLSRNLGDDFDFLNAVSNPNSKLGKLYSEALDSKLVRAKAYLGEKWINKYSRELRIAIDKDNRERGYY